MLLAQVPTRSCRQSIVRGPRASRGRGEHRAGADPRRPGPVRGIPEAGAAPETPEATPTPGAGDGPENGRSDRRRPPARLRRQGGGVGALLRPDHLARPDGRRAVRARAGRRRKEHATAAVRRALCGNRGRRAGDRCQGHPADGRRAALPADTFALRRQPSAAHRRPARHLRTARGFRRPDPGGDRTAVAGRHAVDHRRSTAAVGRLADRPRVGPT